MRSVLACVLVVAAAAACGKHEAEGQPVRAHAGSAGDLAAEQAKFDAERQPEKLVEAMGIQPGAHVADVGAGEGLITVHLARAVAPGGKVIATDIDGGVLELLDQRLRAVGLSDVVERRVVTGDAPGLEPGAYDAILLAEVDHYFSDPVAWLRAAATALKPGGKIVIENRTYHRDKAIEAARRAGLVLQSETTPVPTHYIAVFVAAGKKP